MIAATAPPAAAVPAGGPGWTDVLTAIGTAALAVFAIVTAVLAYMAFRKQAQEVRAIERQVADGQELTRQQADLLVIQTGQLEALRGQLEQQRKAGEAQAEVLALQAKELGESLRERERDAEKHRRSQAARVTAWFALTPGKTWAAVIRNASELPVLDVRTFFHYVAEQWQGGDWDTRPLGGPTERIRVLPPEQERVVTIPDNVFSQMTEVSENNYVVSIEFTDAAGNRWERDPHGALNARS